MRRFAILLLVLALLAACSPASPPDETDLDVVPQPSAVTDVTVEPGTEPATDQEPVTISFAVWEYERRIYEPLVQKFEAENPHITVVLVPLDDLVNVQEPEGPPNPLTTLRRVVSGADTAPMFFVAPEALGSNLLMDLTPLMDADANFSRDDFYPGALDAYTVNGGTWVLPRSLNVQILTYNKDLFKLANLPEPQPGWTWNDLFGAAEQLARANGSVVDTYGFFDPSSGFTSLLAILEAQGIDLLTTPAQEVQLDRTEIVAAVERVREMGKSGTLFLPRYKVEGDPGVDPWQLIRDGRVGIWPADFMAAPCDGPGCRPPSDSYGFATGKVPYPSLAANFYGGGEGYIISAGTAHPNEAWKWIEFLSRQPIEQAGPGVPIDAQFPGRIPARQSLAEQTGFWKNIDEQTAAAYRWAIAHPPKQPTHTPDYLAFGALSQALAQVVNEDQEPRKVLAEAQKQLQEQVAQVQLTPTPTPDTSPVLVATPEPQEAPEGATAVTFAVPGYGTSEMRRLARAFREQHPEFFVKITSTDIFTGPMELKDVARISDCFTWWAPPQSDADFAALLDLQPLFDADASFPQSEYSPALLAPYRRDGGLYGLPYAFNVRTLTYNRTAFEAAGVALPTYAWKPSDFLAAAQALTKGEGEQKQYGYVPLGGIQADMFFFIGQFGARLTRGSGDELRPNFDDPKVAEAIQWYLDLATVHKVMPPIVLSYRRDAPPVEDRSYELVQNGRAAMWFDQGYGMFGGIKGEGGPQPNFEVGVAPLPIGGGGLRSSELYVRGFHIAAQTQQAQACWEWLKFLSGDASNLQGGIPARTSIAQSEEFAKLAQPGMVEIYQAYAEALKHEGQPGDDPNALYSQKMDLYWFWKAIDDALKGEADLGVGLAAAQKTTTAFIECQLKGGKPATCATEVDPTYQGWNVEEPGGPIVVPIAPRG
jgi:multiple sugar transport system substrate-binding protein